MIAVAMNEMMITRSQVSMLKLNTILFSFFFYLKKSSAVSFSLSVPGMSVDYNVRKRLYIIISSY